MIIDRSIEHRDMIDKLLDLIEEAGMDDWELLESKADSHEMFQLRPNDDIAIAIARSFDYICVSLRPKCSMSESPQNWPVTLVAMLPTDIERLREVCEKVYVDLQRRLAERISNRLHFDKE
jgi:hypothetical protein